MKKRLQQKAPAILFVSAEVSGILPGLYPGIYKQLNRLIIDCFFVFRLLAGMLFCNNKAQCIDNFIAAADQSSLSSSYFFHLLGNLICPKTRVVPSGLPHQELFLRAKKHWLGGPEMNQVSGNKV